MIKNAFDINKVDCTNSWKETVVMSVFWTNLYSVILINIKCKAKIIFLLEHFSLKVPCFHWHGCECACKSWRKKKSVCLHAVMDWSKFCSTVNVFMWSQSFECTTCFWNSSDNCWNCANCLSSLLLLTWLLCIHV